MLFNNRRPVSGQQYQTRWVWGVRQGAKRSAPKPFQEAIMTNREHKKLLRAIRHQQGMRESQQLAKKIDRAFSRISEDCSNRVVLATSLGSLRDKPAQEEITERRNRIWYKQPGERGITCSGRQKMKLTSKPLI